MEEFRIIEDFPDYEVSNFGRIRSKARIVNYKKVGTRKKLERFLTLSNDKDGYKIVALYNGKIRKNFKVHRLIAITFIPNLENKAQINHKNGNKKDNRVENLEWVTSSQNIQHAYRIGLMSGQTGEKNPKAKLTYFEVTQIRKLSFTQKYTKTYLSKMFNISLSRISEIIHNKAWMK